MFPPLHRIRCFNRLLTLAGISCQLSTGASFVGMPARENLTASSECAKIEFASQRPTLCRAVRLKKVLEPEKATNNFSAYFPSFASRYRNASYAASLAPMLSCRDHVRG